MVFMCLYEMIFYFLAVLKINSRPHARQAGTLPSEGLPLFPALAWIIHLLLLPCISGEGGHMHCCPAID
jgi:hypothetical protein